MRTHTFKDKLGQAVESNNAQEVSKLLKSTGKALISESFNYNKYAFADYILDVAAKIKNQHIQIMLLACMEERCVDYALDNFRVRINSKEVKYSQDSLHCSDLVKAYPDTGSPLRIAVNKLRKEVAEKGQDIDFLDAVKQTYSMPLPQPQQQPQPQQPQPQQPQLQLLPLQYLIAGTALATCLTSVLVLGRIGIAMAAGTSTAITIALLAMNYFKVLPDILVSTADFSLEVALPFSKLINDKYLSVTETSPAIS